MSGSATTTLHSWANLANFALPLTPILNRTIRGPPNSGREQSLNTANANRKEVTPPDADGMSLARALARFSPQNNGARCS